MIRKEVCKGRSCKFSAQTAAADVHKTSLFGDFHVKLSPTLLPTLRPCEDLKLRTEGSRDDLEPFRRPSVSSVLRLFLNSFTLYFSLFSWSGGRSREWNLADINVI